jgi:hypothetical protein
VLNEDVWGSGCIASASFLTSAIIGGEWSASSPCRFISKGKSPRYGHEAGWTTEPVWTIRSNIFLPYRDSNSDPSVFQPAASRYTDCDTGAAPLNTIEFIILLTVGVSTYFNKCLPRPKIHDIRSVVIKALFQKEFYNSISNGTTRRVLRKRLHLKAYKLSIIQGVGRWTVYTPSCLTFRNTRHIATFGKPL